MLLELQYKVEGEWVPCFDIPDVKIPTVSYLGFSAETGELSDNFDIISVETKNLYNAAQAGTQRTAPDPNKAGRKNNKNKSSTTSDGSSGGSWTWFFVKLLVFVAICGGGYVGFTMYKGSRRSNRF